MIRLLSALALAALLASCACAGTVTVSPDNMQGWAVAVNQNGLAYFTPSGVVLYETTAGFPSGRGAFYAQCQSGGTSQTDKTPDTVWLGLDTLNGQPLAGVTLNQIKTLKYTGYVSDMVTYNATTTEWKYPREPICLQFVITDAAGNRRNLWFRPWSNKPQGHGYGGNPADQMAQWITYDCINCTPQFQGPKATITPLWSEPQSNQVFKSWAEVCAAYGSWTLVATSTTFDPANGQFKSPGWDNSTTPIGAVTATGTGMPLNFEVGARKFAYNGIWGATSNTNWFPESINFRGYVDTFTLGVDFNGDGDDEDPGENTTFDFEPAAATPTPRLVAMNLRSIAEGQDLGGYTGDRTGYAAIWDLRPAWKVAWTRLCVSATNVSQTPETGVPEGIYSENGNTVSAVYADVTDGSSGIPVPIKLRVRDPDGSLFEKMQFTWGDYVGVSGEVRRKPGGLLKMRYIWSCAGNTVDYNYTPDQ